MARNGHDKVLRKIYGPGGHLQGQQKHALHRAAHGRAGLVLVRDTVSPSDLSTDSPFLTASFSTFGFIRRCNLLDKLGVLFLNGFTLIQRLWKL